MKTSPTKPVKAVYGRLVRLWVVALVVAGGTSPMTFAQSVNAGNSAIAGSDIVLDARDAFRRRDRNRLATDRAAAAAASLPLAPWVDYWELNNRLSEATQADLEAFYARWKGSYVEDRLRNDWLQELGRRRDWTNFALDYPRFRMNDDREVSCYALLVDHLGGKPVDRDAARGAWIAQRDADVGCALTASTLLEAKVLKPADAWLKARYAMDAGRPRAAAQAAGLIAPLAGARVQDLTENASRFLARRASTESRTESEITTLALMKLASSDPDAAAAALGDRWERALPPELAGWAWAEIAKQASIKLQANGPDYFQRADSLRGQPEIDWPDEILAWKVRAALRANGGKARWQQVVQAINAMSGDEQRDAAWVYWKARALSALASDSQDTAALSAQGREMLDSIAGQVSFYGALATETLGRPLALPPKPPTLTAAERADAASHPGLTRALQLIAIGLRSEGVREWNYSLRGMSDRELLAAAQIACDREIWDRCINTSERTKVDVDMDQRFPTPFRRDLLARSRETGIDPAYVYGVIRQESRFITDAKSSVGASGLMQVMPATARYTAKKLGLDYNGQINDRDMNLRLGTGYLKLVLDDFEGSQPMAAAAYNAGPGRPRRWREGPLLEPAAWAENIPFNETRDYVKKVVANATFYAALLTGQPPQLKTRLGRMIGPRTTPPPAIDAELP